MGVQSSPTKHGEKHLAISFHGDIYAAGTLQFRDRREIGGNNEQLDKEVSRLWSVRPQRGPREADLPPPRPPGNACGAGPPLPLLPFKSPAWLPDLPPLRSQLCRRLGLLPESLLHQQLQVTQLLHPGHGGRKRSPGKIGGTRGHGEGKAEPPARRRACADSPRPQRPAPPAPPARRVPRRPAPGPQGPAGRRLRSCLRLRKTAAS